MGAREISLVAAMLAGSGCSSCVVRGSRVRTPIGLRAIESLRVGDEVIAVDRATGAVSARRVIEIFRGRSEEIVSVDVDGRTVEVTPNHPFAVDSLDEHGAPSWVEARALLLGMRLVLVTA